MYEPIDLARFAISEFERGLEGLTDEEARTRLTKADGSQMNAISWIAGHIAGHYLHRPPGLKRYAFGSDDPTPPSLDEARDLLRGARGYVESWLPRADAELMSGIPPDGLSLGENVGTALLRCILHTWFHAGEINAIRQMLGHAEIPFVGKMAGVMEWKG